MRGLEARVARHRPRGLLIALGCALALIATGGWLVFRSDQSAVRAVRTAHTRLPSVRPAQPAERTPVLEPQRVPAAAPPVQSAVSSLIRKPQPSPWQRAGQCTAGVEPRSVLDRARYFATFARVEAPDTTLFVEARVSEEAVATVRGNLTHARVSAKRQLGIDASPPLIYLYASVESLRDHACVNSSAVAYYDGAIHLAMNSPEDHYIKLNRSLRHEYVHHVLITNGIDEPMWLQEGTALLIAGELSWFKWHPTGRMLPTREMIHQFPQTASSEFTEAFYG